MSEPWEDEAMAFEWSQLTPEQREMIERPRRAGDALVKAASDAAEAMRRLAEALRQSPVFAELRREGRWHTPKRSRLLFETCDA